MELSNLKFKKLILKKHFFCIQNYNFKISHNKIWNCETIPRSAVIHYNYVQNANTCLWHHENI